jgi:hypothetical protein
LSDDVGVVRAAPLIDPRLLRLARRLDRNPRPIAAIVRDVGAYAERIGIPRPSYEQLRVHVHEARARREEQRRARELLLDVELGVRSPRDLLPLFERVLMAGPPLRERERRAPLTTDVRGRK